MKEVATELASLITSLNLGNEEMPIEECVLLAGKEMHSRLWLSSWILHAVEKFIWV